ncbi:hypothetical protein J3459_014918 [Metarhizium acridum]|nr:hypothetical protein J3459_014918 [Metarhizium acridum]
MEQAAKRRHGGIVLLYLVSSAALSAMPLARALFPLPAHQISLLCCLARTDHAEMLQDSALTENHLPESEFEQATCREQIRAVPSMQDLHGAGTNAPLLIRRTDKERKEERKEVRKIKRKRKSAARAGDCPALRG